MPILNSNIKTINRPFFLTLRARVTYAQTCLMTSSFWDILRSGHVKSFVCQTCPTMRMRMGPFFTHSPRETLLKFNPVARMVGRVVEW